MGQEKNVPTLPRGAIENLSAKSLDNILKSTVNTIEMNKTQIFDIYEAARGEVDVERGDLFKLGVVGNGEDERVGQQGDVERGKGGVVQGEQAAVGGVIVAEVFADGIGQVKGVIGAFDAALAVAQGIERCPAPGFAAAQVAHFLPAGEGLLL